MGPEHPKPLAAGAVGAHGEVGRCAGVGLSVVLGRVLSRAEVVERRLDLRVSQGSRALGID